ncbi:MAG: GIY-YIG nuclease family protein [Deltaproteobacteria bacterium]|nr:GIY-YIG nuclease family protein [Deltaproteobacteria bacterium]
MFYTYVLRSHKDSNLYVGYTSDLKLRPAQLNNALH